MSGSFGVPVKVEGLTDVNQNLINIQRSLSDLFSKISEVTITTAIVIDAEPFLNGGSIGASGTITAAPMASTGLLGGPGGTVAGVVAIGAGLSMSGGTITATPGGGAVTRVDTTGPGIIGGPITSVGALEVQWNAGQVLQITNRFALVGSTLDVVAVLGVGTATNAAAGIVGEFISSTVLVGSAVPLTSGAPSNVTSMTLTPGDWDVGGNVVFDAGATTTITVESAGISLTSSTMPTAPGTGAYVSLSASFTTGGDNAFPVGVTRLSLAVSTTVFLVANASFGVSTLSAYGFIGARRRR
jgi:hypothetical protein